MGVLGSLYGIWVSQLTLAKVSMMSMIPSVIEPILEARLNPIFANRRLTPRPSVSTNGAKKTIGHTKKAINMNKALNPREAPLKSSPESTFSFGAISIVRTTATNHGKRAQDTKPPRSPLLSSKACKIVSTNGLSE